MQNGSGLPDKYPTVPEIIPGGNIALCDFEGRLLTETLHTINSDAFLTMKQLTTLNIAVTRRGILGDNTKGNQRSRVRRRSLLGDLHCTDELICGLDDMVGWHDNHGGARIGASNKTRPQRHTRCRVAPARLGDEVRA